jgi:hypothetical protein
MVNDTTLADGADLDELLFQWRRDYRIDDDAYHALLRTVSYASPVNQHSGANDPIQQLLHAQALEPPLLFQQYQTRYGEFCRQAELPNLNPISANAAHSPTHAEFVADPNLLRNNSFNNVHNMAAPAVPASDCNSHHNNNFNDVHTMVAPRESAPDDTPFELDLDQFVQLPDDLEFFVLPDTTLPINQQLARANVHPQGFIEEPERSNLQSQGSAVSSDESYSSDQALSSEPPDWNIVPPSPKSVPCIKCWYDKKKVCCYMLLNPKY